MGRITTINNVKSFYQPMIVALLLTSPALAEDAGKHLYILAGQSNMQGLDPDLSFTPTVASALGNENVVVVKDAHSGKPIRRWYKRWKSASGKEPPKKHEIGDLYDCLMVKVAEATKGHTIRSVTLVWMQGERDAKEKHGEVYAASLRGLIDQLEGDLGRQEINFVIGRLSDYGEHTTKYPHWSKVRAAQMKVAEADKRGAWVDTDDLNSGKHKEGKPIEDDLHYSVQGYKTLGKRFAESALSLLSDAK